MLYAVARVLPLPRPIVNSAMSIGSPRTAKKTRYMAINAAPPYCAQIYGNFHTFPRPMAHPAETSINPRRELKRSLFIFYPHAKINSASSNDNGDFSL
jgi:hypothetical protein